MTAASAAEANVSWVTGPISVISSITIVIMILRSKRALTIPYHRILFGISVADIISSVAMSASSLPAPKNSEHLAYAYGNQATCDAQGFIFLAGSTAEPLYQCSLQLYYLCMVKYGMSAENIQKKIEPYLHCIPILFALIAAVVSVATESINSSGAWCYIESYPRGCREECPRGSHIILKRILFSAIPMFFSFIFMSVAMVVIYREARGHEMRASRLRFRASTPAPQEGERNQRRSIIGNLRSSLTSLIHFRSPEECRRSRKILRRIVQYYAAYLLANAFPLLANFGVAFGERVNVLFIIQNILYPLQGFYTLLVVINPHYRKLRKSSANLSILKAFVVSIMSYGGAIYTESADQETDDTYEENQPVSHGTCTDAIDEEDIDE